MAYQPLTPEQFQSARKAGFSPEKITAMELKRKSEMDGTPAPVEQKPDGILKSMAKGIISPVATLAARPIQLGAELLGASSETVDRVSNKVSGGLVAPTPKGIKDVVRDVGRGAEAISLGVGGGGVVKAGLKGLVKEGAIQGAKGGALYGGGSALEQGKGVGGVIKDTAIGGLSGGVLGGAIVGAVPASLKAVNAVRNLHVERATRAAREFDDLAGRVIQGTPDDIGAAKKVLSEIDSRGIKTYQDLGEALDNKIEVISGKLDEALDTEPYVKSLDELAVTKKVGDAEISHNFVQDALKQMDEFYAKVNDIEGKARVQQLAQKAQKEGLSIREINDLAREHGRKLNGFNANGELASGLSKVAAENTRKGLKETARRQFNSPLFKEADTELSKLINVRENISKMEVTVNKAKQKIRSPKLMERVGSLFEKVLNIGTLGTSRGFLQAAGKAMGTIGNPLRMDAVALEQMLTKNLSRIQKIADSDLPEDQIIQKLEQFLAENGVPASKPVPLNKK